MLSIFFLQLNYVGYEGATMDGILNSDLEFATVFKFPNRNLYDFVRDEIMVTRNTTTVANVLSRHIDMNQTQNEVSNIISYYIILSIFL